MIGCSCGAATHNPMLLVRDAGTSRRRHDHLVIDTHAHVFAPAVEALAKASPAYVRWRTAMGAKLGEDFLSKLQGQFDELIPKLGPDRGNLEIRLRDLDALGIDIQLLSPSPHQYHYWADEQTADALVDVHNDEIASICALAPDRLVGLGVVSLQHPQLAADQLEKAMKTYGLKGVEISTSAHGADFSDPSYEPFWAKAQEMGATVFIHPMGSSFGSRLDPYYLSNAIGQPLETAIALSHMIFSGVFDRFPALKILAAHGGGYLPFYTGRIDHVFHVRPEARSPLLHPSEYLRKIYFDTVVHDPLTLRALINRVGRDQVVIGTDYPYDMGDYDFIAHLEAAEIKDEADRKHVLGTNAQRLLGI